MNIEFKESSGKLIAKNSIFLYTRMALIMIMSLIGVRIVLKSLQFEDYGIYNAIAGVVTSLSFLTTVLANASQRYFAYSIGLKDERSLNSYLGIIIVVYVVISFLVIAIAESIGLWFVNNKMNFEESRMYEVNIVYQLSLLTFLFSLHSSPLLALIIAHEDMQYYSFISIIDGVLKLLVACLLFLFLSNRLIVYSALLTVVSLITFLLYYIIIRKKYPYIKFQFNWQGKSIKEIFSFSAWSCFGSVANIASHQGINILFNIFIGPIANASFAIANQVNAAVNTFSSSFFSSVRPGMIKSYANHDNDKLMRLYYFSTKMIFALLFIIILPLLTQTEFILGLWLGELSEYMVQFTQMMLVASLVLSLSLPMTTIIQATGNVKWYHLLTDGFIILSIILIYVVLKMRLGPIVALVVLILVYSIAHIIRLIVLNNQLHMRIKDYFFICIFPIALIFILNYNIVRYLSTIINFSPVSTFILIFIISTFLNIVLYYLILLDNTEKEMLNNVIKKLLNTLVK